MFKYAMMFTQVKSLLGSFNDDQKDRLRGIARGALVTGMVDPEKKPLLHGILNAATETGDLAKNMEAWTSSPAAMASLQAQNQISAETKELGIFLCPHCNNPTDLSGR